MNRRFPIIAGMFLLFATLACGPLSSDPEPTVTVTVIATPTLAPTSTPDPAAEQTPTPPVSSDLTPETAENGDPTPEPLTETNETSPENGQPAPDPAGTEGDDGAPGGTEGGGGGAPAACPSGGQNLLTNPSFEGQYAPFGAFVELNHAPSWFPWWQDGQSNLRPEFKPAESATAPNRVHSGTSAQQYFKSFGQFKAGLFQSVLNVPVGSRLQFSIFGQAWSCEKSSDCGGGNSVNPADMLMRVGIDPTGDTLWSADTVIWSPYFNPLDQWQVACIEAVTERDIVTVFLWASPDGPRQNQDVYWDDASLVVVP